MTKNIKGYIRLLTQWLWLGRYHLISFAAFVVVLLYLTKMVTFFPKVVTFLMVLAGLTIIVAQQILDADKFNEHSPNTLTNWLKSFPTGKPVILSLEGNIGVSCSLKGHMTVSVSPELPIEKKVEFLLSRVNDLDLAIYNVSDRIDNISSALSKTENKLQESMNILSKSLSKVIASHVVGTYDLNLLGINITICGTVIQFFAE